jgi:hypothetical protein
MRIHLGTIAVLASCFPWAARSQDIQLTLKSAESVYSQGAPIKLSYEVLWLGEGDGRVFENSLAFPALEISYLNRFRVEMVELYRFVVRTEPSRHERHTFAPTMRFESKAFQINDSTEGVQFLDGRVGYYRFEKAGTYVIRAIFRKSFGWKLYDAQRGDVFSNAIVVEIVP